MGVIGGLPRWSRRLGLAVLVIATSAILAITSGFVLYFSAVNLQRYGDGRSLQVPVDVVLVLGGGHDGDGMISPSSRRRVRTAVGLLQAGRTQNLIFSGGRPAGSSDVQEAFLMRDFALTLGAPAERLLTELKAASTFGNLRYGFALARTNGFERIAILTDAFHLERARRLSTYLGHPQVGLIAADGLRGEPVPVRVWSILRESLAWWYNLARIAGLEILRLAGFGAEERSEQTR